MARLIVKSPYIKCGGNQGADGYMRYIATRERVEIIPDDRPPTRKQEQLITKLTKDFPDVKELLEYDDYVQKPTKANASSLITLALEEHWKQVQQTDGYMKYIATRPRAALHRQRLDVHPLSAPGGHHTPWLRQCQSMAEPAPRQSQWHRRRHEHSAEPLPLVCRLPRRGKASPYAHDSVVNTARRSGPDVGWLPAISNPRSPIRSSNRRCSTPTNKSRSPGTSWCGEPAA